MDAHRLFVSVDMDEWYLCRWATGSMHAFWPDVATLFREAYQAERPIGEIYVPTERILALFEALHFTATFFFTGQVARWYPDLVKTIAGAGHEIGCHNERHIDYEYEPRDTFYRDVTTSKKLLEDLSGQAVIGYRSPNSSMPITIVEDLERAGFRYDSSVTPTRRFMGKFGAHTHAPRRPYHPEYTDIGREGNARLWEFPWAVFPLVQLPAGSGIMHRIGGSLYNALATHFSLRHGHTAYYFHPYEISSLTYVPHRRLGWRVRIFLRGHGEPYFRRLKRFLTHYQDILVNGRGLLAFHNQE